ncbi:golgin subfamily A member 4-like isoform X3 [Linepithema humile]|uniref:golgin subfamily A member 4-like isoform X3 n=1 Tax=Linepithema humile TaxID=83485 RepID=UPI00351E415B
MSTSQDEDERKKRSLEAGREMLEKYKAQQSAKGKSTNVEHIEQSDDESLAIDKSMMHVKESNIHEGISSRDITHSSVSISEGEADVDLEGLAGRVAELEELLQGKEAIVGALNAEIDHLRAEASSPNSSQSRSSSIHGRDIISLYHVKLQEFEKAVNQRDNLIEHLTSSLEQALSARDAVTKQLNALNTMQLTNPTINNVNLQQKIEVLETTMSDQDTLIRQLNAQLTDIRKHVQTLEMERETRNAEINDYKMQINNLNEQIRLGAAEKNLNIDETLEQQKQYEARVDKIKQDMQHILNKFTTVTNANAVRHQQELKDLTSKNEAEMNMKISNIKAKHEECMQILKDENKVLADRLNKELPDLETRHAKELSVFQTQLSHYKKTIEALKLELVNQAESQNIAQSEVHLYKTKLDELRFEAENERRMQSLHFQKEKELLNEQIKLHKIQLEEITSKHVTSMSILESKESIERSLEQALLNAATLKQENDTLKFKLDDLSYRYSAAQSMIENSQVHERTLSGKIFEMERSLSRFDATSISTISELGETMYKTFDENVQNQMTKQKLEEKTEMEKLLIEKIHILEEEMLKTNDELEQANLAKKVYEKQLKDMKNTCDKLQQEVNSSKQSNRVTSDNSIQEHLQSSTSTSLVNVENENDPTRRIENQQREIESLKLLMEQKETENMRCKKDLAEMTEKAKKMESQCNELRCGLANAWAQCAEFEEKLNQTLLMSDSSKINTSLNTTSSKQHKTNESLDDSASDHSAVDQKKVLESHNTSASTLIDNSYLKNDNENLYKELQQILDESSLDEVKFKLRRYYTLCEKIAVDKTENTDNTSLQKQQESADSLQRSLDNLRMEKELLGQEIEDMMNRCKKELQSVKTDSAKEIDRLHSLLQNLKDGDARLNDLKSELEARHAKEMEELRTYFERKCLQMEKQYSEEIFSQQSKRISDNDSETEELTDDLYFGGAGDCLNVSNSRAATPSAVDESLKGKILEDNTRLESEFEGTLQTLRQELEYKVNEIQNIKASYEKALEEQKELYECQIRDTEAKLERSTIFAVDQYCQTEWEALENGELSSLRDAYNHQLAEQIALARQDIVTALQEKIQTLLSVEGDKEDNWPAELLELRDKFTCNAKQEIQELRKMHSAELACLKDEHDCLMTQMREQHQKEIAVLKTNTQNGDNKQEVSSVRSSENSIMEERDNLRKTCITLKNLIGELVNYFVVCEEEVNNTLINEVLKRQLTESVFTNERNLSKDDNILSTTQRKDSSNQSIKRVHFAPQSSKITSIVNSDNKTLQSLIDEDIYEILRKELKASLRRLKSDSTQILNLSLPSGESPSSSPSKEALLARKINEELSLKLDQAETLIITYQEETEQLRLHIRELQQKLISAENKKEVITEGYGESDLSRGDIALQDFSQVQEKARHVLSNGGGDASYLLQLIEELCRQNDKLMDDARKEREDLQQQVPLEPTPTPYIHRVCCKKIEAADKQLRATRRFLDEQASEREMERDEAAKQIHFLQEQLKEREREKERDMRINSEQSELSSEATSNIPELQAIDIGAAVEALESQMREMSSSISDMEAKKSEKESELKAAVDKIWVLRDIITDLEQQLQVKIEREESLQLQIGQLETVITAQTKNQQELVQELDAIKSGSESRHLNEQINHLQEELSKHKLSSEHFNVNSSVLKQIKAELHEMQNQLDKRIRELESAHMCGSNLSLSQPSEDVSIREQIDATRCLTPDDPSSPPMLPLDQVLKLKDKMLKHARAEEVAFKRIKDLEMQLTAIKNQNEELLAEQEILHQTASEQLFQIEAMRGRLEQHKQSAPFAQKQATSRLELQLHEATTKYHSLEQTIADREMELKELKAQLERVNQMMTEKEMEMENLVRAENDALQKLKDQLKVVQEEKRILQIELEAQEQHTLLELQLPQLIDTMLGDKNEEINHLREQLSKKEKQLNAYSSLALDDMQLRELTKQAEAKNSARTLSDILSIHSECEEFPEAIRTTNVTNATSHNVSSFKVPTSVSKNTLNTNSLNTLEVPLLDMDRMDVQVPPLELDMLSFSNGIRHSDMELQRVEGESKLSSPKNDVSEESQQAEELLDEKLKEIENLSYQLQTLQQELELKSDLLGKYEIELASLQKQYKNIEDEFKETVENLMRDKDFYKNQYELSQASEGKIKKDLEEVENILKLKTNELQDQKDRMQVNEKIITELNTENTKLKKEMEVRERDQTKRSNFLLQERLQELQRLTLEKDIALETLQTRNIEIENENKQLYDFKMKVHAREREIAELQDEIQRLRDGLNNRDLVIRKLEEMAKRTSDVQSGTSSPSSSSSKDQEIHHLQEFLKEKDKVIRQMSDDSKSLHRALETIQSKMKESGNIVELRRKLKDERRMNEELRDIVQSLQKELELKDSSAQRSQDDSDIEDMVQRELNLSARLDKQIMEVIKDDAEEVAGGTTEGHQQKLNELRKDNEILKRLKDDLEVERDIMKHQIAEYEDRILQLKADLAEETKKIVKLDRELASERNTAKFLRMQIEENRRITEAGRVQDTKLVEYLQKKLQVSLENEEKLRNDLALMRQEQINLDSKLISMRKLLEAENNRNVTKDELERTSENVEENCENNAELRVTLKRLETEVNKCEKRLEIADEERERLISGLALANGLKEILEADLRRTADDLKAREEECNYLQKQLKMFTEAEGKKQEQRDVELEEIKGLRKEISIAREARIDLEADIKLAKQELKESSDRELKLARTVESWKERETELIAKLTTSKEKERKLKELIETLQSNLKTEREDDIRHKLVSSSFAQRNKELNETVEKYTAEKSYLEDKLGRVRVEREILTQRMKQLEGQVKELKSTQASSQQTAPIERLQNFYGQYLRVDSRRKALAYQKKYLLCILGTYQYCEENTLCVLAQLTQDQRSYTRMSHKKKVRFRIAVLAIISMHRMKWLIQRWRTGKRVGANAIMGNVGQLIDLPPVRKTALNHSPPVRERTTNGNSGLSGFTLEQYYQQVRNFQEILDSVMEESEPSHIISK